MLWQIWIKNLGRCTFRRKRQPPYHLSVYFSVPCIHWVIVRSGQHLSIWVKNKPTWSRSILQSCTQTSKSQEYDFEDKKKWGLTTCEVCGIPFLLGLIGIIYSAWTSHIHIFYLFFTQVFSSFKNSFLLWKRKGGGRQKSTHQVCICG